MLTWAVRIATHGVKRQRLDRIGESRIEIHVFTKAVRFQKKCTTIAGRQRAICCHRKLQRQFLPMPHDHETVIRLLHQFRDVPVPRVVS